MESEKETKEKSELRPLTVYGQTVVNLFTDEIESDVPVCLLPVHNRDQIPCQESYQEFFFHAQEKWSETLRAVSLLKSNLQDEKRQAAAAKPDQMGEIKTPILDRFLAFQEALRKGDEEEIEDNPFLKVTRMVFQLNMEAAQGTMREAVIVALAKWERTNMRAFPSIPEIWRLETRGFRGIGRKLYASLRSLLIGFKPYVSVLLFVLSSVTTFRGVNELLQLPLAQKLFGNLFLGHTGEAARYVVGVTIGVSLSLAILDFKGRIFQGIAEKGKIWKGLIHALGVHPRWIILATLLTFFSIYTNYDGIVSLVSKQGELQKQWIEIKGRVEGVLGTSMTANPDHPQTLHGLKKALELTAQQAVETFKNLPEDELSGIASSQDPRKGPRYWAKHFVVFGGFTEGVVDVPKVHVSSETSKNINTILLGSGLNFGKGIEEKIQELTGRYSNSFSNTVKTIHHDLEQLDLIMSPGERSMASMRRFMSLEYYDINALVQHITASFEENKRVYDGVATELNQLLKAHVAVLRQVDKYGNTPQVDYTISATVDVPAIDGIEALKKGVIPVATHKDLVALNQFLTHEHGPAKASLILMSILLFSISLDLGELLLFTRFTVRIARKDEKHMDDKTLIITTWHDEFIGNIRGFFEKKEVWFSLLSWLPRPSEILMRDALFTWLYKMNGELRLSGGRAGLLTRWKFWFIRLFSAVARKEICYALMAWDSAMDRIQTALHKNNCQYLSILYPGLRWDAKLDKMSFHQLATQLTASMKRGQIQFEESLKTSSDTPLCKKIIREPITQKVAKSKVQRDFEMSLDMAFQDLDPQSRQKRQNDNASPIANGKQTDDETTCSRCGTRGFRRSWRCAVIKMTEPYTCEHPHGSFLDTIYKMMAYGSIHFVYCPLWYGYSWLFQTSFIKENQVFPWSRKKWLYEFCVSKRGRQERHAITSAEKNKSVDITDILKKIPRLKHETIVNLIDRLDKFDAGWAVTWKLSIRHYENVLLDIEDEARMIQGLGKDADDVADEMLLYNKNIATGDLLYYESPHNFSLLEQFKTIEMQINDALNRVGEIDDLFQRKIQYAKEIEETSENINRLLVSVKMDLVSG
ncbi:MAG: hypothetical protein HQL62_00145, partial [Magnetococcales bacterium]|nr:hypothetical protein [Magnetococcales bacterium]